LTSVTPSGPNGQQSCSPAPAANEAVPSMPLFDLARARERRRLALAGHPSSAPGSRPASGCATRRWSSSSSDWSPTATSRPATCCRRRPSSRRPRPVPDAPAGTRRGRAETWGLAESGYIGHTRTSAGGSGGALAGRGPVGDAANASSHRRRRCRRHPRRHRRPLIGPSPRARR
jgi:hypothetical protein